MDADRITRGEAAEILGRSPRTVSRLVDNGTIPRIYEAYRAYLSREVVEAVALSRWARRDHKPGGYWATATEAAEVLGVSQARVGQLVTGGRLPELRAPTRRRLYRRAQIESSATHEECSTARSSLNYPRRVQRFPDRVRLDGARCTSTFEVDPAAIRTVGEPGFARLELLDAAHR